MECRSVSRTSKRGTKYVFWEEAQSFAARGQSVIIYHHLHRARPSFNQIEFLRQEFAARMRSGFLTLDHTFTRGTRRTFFLATAPSHQELIGSRLSRMIAARWGAHFPPTDANTGRVIRYEWWPVW